MATRHKSLTYTPSADEVGGEPEVLTFTIREVAGDVEDAPALNAARTFTAVQEIPGIVALDLGRASDDGTPEAEKMAILYKIITKIVVEEDQARFERLLRDADPVITGVELMDYVRQILEEISGRPTEGQQPSAGSLPATQTGSTDGSVNGAATLSEGSPV